jgi:hypothetical protein
MSENLQVLIGVFVFYGIVAALSALNTYLKRRRGIRR